ncbi:MAG TPA: hypothetical protein VMU19_02755 [Bryobacteraceae bacterium]|nr:hypothetical protein [Bryobacteraceae bacterium]
MRFACLALALCLAACQKSAPPLDLFAPSVAGVWTRTALTNTPVSDAPDPVPRTAVTSLITAAYEGPGKLEAREYTLDSDTVGTTLSQRWQPSADTIFFSRGRYFIVVKWQSADRQALQNFVRELQKKLPPAPPL